MGPSGLGGSCMRPRLMSSDLALRSADDDGPPEPGHGPARPPSLLQQPANDHDDEEAWPRDDDDAYDDDYYFEYDIEDAPLPTALTLEDKLTTAVPATPFRRKFRLGLPLIVSSLAAHAVLAVLFVQFAPNPHAIAEEQETPVEIVQEPAPPEPKKEVQAPEPPKPVAKAPETPKDEAKQEPAKAEPAKPDPVKPPEAAKPVGPPKAAKEQEPPKARETAKSQQPPQALQPDAKRSQTDTREEDAKALQALQDELAGLKQQSAELEAKAAELNEPAKELGPLPDSFRAVALPATSLTGEDSVTYEQEVFSLLAKAKKAGRHVVTPGVAHVVFNIDVKGNLIDVTLDHPSGNEFLDNESLAIVRRAAPFPVPPQGALRRFSAYMKFVAED